MKRIILAGILLPVLGACFPTTTPADAANADVFSIDLAFNRLAADSSPVEITLQAASSRCAALREEAAFTVNGQAAPILSRGNIQDTGCSAPTLSASAPVPLADPRVTVVWTDSTGSATFEVRNPTGSRTATLLEPADGLLRAGTTVRLRWDTPGEPLSDLELLLESAGDMATYAGTRESADADVYRFELTTLPPRVVTTGSITLVGRTGGLTERCDFGACTVKPLTKRAPPIGVTFMP